LGYSARPVSGSGSGCGSDNATGSGTDYGNVTGPSLSLGCVARLGSGRLIGSRIGFG
jgi:hypothetical protein